MAGSDTFSGIQLVPGVSAVYILAACEVIFSSFRLDIAALILWNQINIALDWKLPSGAVFFSCVLSNKDFRSGVKQHLKIVPINNKVVRSMTVLFTPPLNSSPGGIFLFFSFLSYGLVISCSVKKKVFFNLCNGAVTAFYVRLWKHRWGEKRACVNINTNAPLASFHFSAVCVTCTTKGAALINQISFRFHITNWQKEFIWFQFIKAAMSNREFDAYQDRVQRRCKQDCHTLYHFIFNWHNLQVLASLQT